MKRFVALFFLCHFILVFTLISSAQEYHLQSPDRNIHLKIQLKDQIYFSLYFKSRQIITPSPLSMTTQEHGILGNNPKVLSREKIKTSQTEHPVVRQKSKTIQARYQQLTLKFTQPYILIFRAYNQGVAYRIKTNFPGDVTVLEETVNLGFAKDFKVYFPEEKSFLSHNERYYTQLPLSKISSKQMGSLPLLIEAQKQVKILITESDLFDYPGLWFRGNNNKQLTGIFPAFPLKETLKRDRDMVVTERAGYIAKTRGSRSFPWRILAIAEKDSELITNQLPYLLASPNQLKETAWIKPGKVAWDWWNANNIYGVNFKAGINTATYKYYIDFAAKYGIEYIIMDEGWYKLGDLLAVQPEINMEEIMAYAKQKDVGVILWVIWKTLDDQLQEALDQFEKWGAKGIKVDFMQRDDQWMVNYYHKIAKEAAKRKMIVDFHGSYKPAGLHRTYPNVLTREGVRGLEQSKWSTELTPDHNVTIPFIRMVAGPMDYTPGAMINAQKANFKPIFNRPMSMGTRCHQLAMYVIYESPLQMLCDSPSNYFREPECTEFIARIPTVWDKTIVLQARIADYIALARQNCKKWYIGAMGNSKGQEMVLSFDFLEKGKNYSAEIFTDGPNADRFGSDYITLKRSIKSGDKLKIKLAPGGGWAAILIPEGN